MEILLENQILQILHYNGTDVSIGTGLAKSDNKNNV